MNTVQMLQVQWLEQVAAHPLPVNPLWANPAATYPYIPAFSKLMLAEHT